MLEMLCKILSFCSLLPPYQLPYTSKTRLGGLREVGVLILRSKITAS